MKFEYINFALTMGSCVHNEQARYKCLTNLNSSSFPASQLPSHGKIFLTITIDQLWTRTWKTRDTLMTGQTTWRLTVVTHPRHISLTKELTPSRKLSKATSPLVLLARSVWRWQLTINAARCPLQSAGWCIPWIQDGYMHYRPPKC